MNNSNRGIQLLYFYLRKWKHFDTNIAYLSNIEKIQMKILYTSLKKLNEDEIKFLFERYRFTEKKPLNNSDAAKYKGISNYEYTKKNKAIEMKLIPYFLESEKKFKEELNKAVIMETERRRRKKRF